ncbi:hypothetical protein QVD17_18810 [Tagetes erecta]|uniref:Uncharacterized protein n=1 Tax=Tagetes erecta TaxID=13708 RepID=A0AAD8KNI3_TARER|nr:hypothetical protein QVD17_18810 [Tagetes erecta]
MSPPYPSKRSSDVVEHTMESKLETKLNPKMNMKMQKRRFNWCVTDVALFEVLTSKIDWRNMVFQTIMCTRESSYDSFMCRQC